MKYKAVLWDWDGTLFDSDRECWRAHNLAHAKYNFPTESYETYRHRPANGIVRALGPEVAPETAQMVRKAFFDYFDALRCDLVEGASEVLLYLQGLSVPCSIISAHPVNEVLASVNRFGLIGHFRHVIGGTREKQATLLTVCKELGVSPDEALFVGDLLSDVKDGNAAGLHTVLYAPLDSPHASRPTYHITSLRDVIPLLQL